jgi:transposase
LLFRKRIAEFSEKESPLSGIIEIDKSYFGARRIKGKQRRGARGKTIVFGILERGCTVYTEIISACKMNTIRSIIQGKISVDAVINTDTCIGKHFVTLRL